MVLNDKLQKMEIVEQAEAALVQNGFKVFRAQDYVAAGDYLLNLAGVGPIVKSYSSTINSMGLMEHLKHCGVSFSETRLADYLVKAEGLTPTDPLYPLKEMETAEITSLLKKHFGLPYQLSYEQATMAAREIIRDQIAKASLGITGANAIIVETGTIAIMEEQGNARLVSNLPPIHVVVATTEKIVPTMAEAMNNLRHQSLRGCGRQMAKYLSFISGPSKTGDIGFNLVKGMHGPGEVHVILM